MIRALGIQTRSACSVIIPDDEPSYDITNACELIELPDFKPGNHSRAALALTALSAPPTPDDMLAGIGMLMMATAHREYAGNDIKAMSAIYAHSLRMYPRDCVLEAIHEWPRRKDGKWMPTVHDLDRLIRRKVSWRRCALEAAKNAAEGEKDH